MTIFSKARTLKGFCTINKNILTNNVRNFIQMKPRIERVNGFQYFIQTRNKSLFGLFRKPTAERYKIKDNIPKQYDLIYRNTMERLLLATQITSTLCAGLVIVLLLINSDVSSYKLNFDEWNTKPKALESEIFVYLTALCAMIILLQLMVMKMPLRIYNFSKQNKYIIVFYGKLPYSTKHISCSNKEVFKLPETGILPWRDSLFQIKDYRGILLLETFFRHPADLSIMLGLQKPPKDEDDDDYYY